MSALGARRWLPEQHFLDQSKGFFPQTDTKTKLMKTTLLRWTLASFHIMAGSVNTETTMPAVLEKAQQKGLLSAKECAETEGNAVIPLLWMINVVSAHIYGMFR